jgi:large subunit ribosomal protein L9
MPQQVILTSDVPGLGQVGDVCKVKDGYARNYLLPQQLAVPATPNSVKRFERQKEKLNAARDAQLTGAKTVAEKLSKVGLVFERQVGQGGRLFGSVTSVDISSELARQGVTVEKRSILMNGSLRTVGDHAIRVRIHSKVVVDIPVKVIGLQTEKKSEHAEHVEEKSHNISEDNPIDIDPWA